MRINTRNSERGDLHNLDKASDQSESIAVHKPDRSHRRSRQRNQLHMIVHTPTLRPSHRAYQRPLYMGGSAMNTMRETESVPGNAVRWMINLPHILRKFEGCFMEWTPGI